MHHFKTAPVTILAGLCAAVALTAPADQLKDEPTEGAVHIASFLEVESKQALLAQTVPGIRISTWDGHSSVYGKPLGHGESPIAAAESFRLNTLPLLGMDADEVQPYANFLRAGTNTVQLMYNPETGQYKFTAVYYSQVRDGLEVFGTRMTALVKNAPNHPLVLANLQLRNLGEFQVDQAQVRQFTPAPAIAFARQMLGNDMQLASEPRMIIWTGIDAMQEAARVAYEFEAEGGDYLNGTYQAYRFIADAATGTIVHKETLIHEVDVTGNISGRTTDGVSADICHGVISVPLPYARAAIGGAFVFADANGNFTIPNAGASQVTVEARLQGQWFSVNNTTSPGGGNSVLTQSVTPPGPANFLFNDPDVPGNGGQYKRAEVNAYVHANKVRDMVLATNPSYPTIGAEAAFPTNVNINQTCNAFYSSLNQSINFYVAGGGCTNTANATVVHHEYGHRLVNAAGSGQGAYGEGMGDCMAVLVTDQPCLGGAFNSPCGTCFRNASNNCMWTSGGSCNSTCGSAIHTCGQVLSGCVWETRNNLAANHPATYQQIIRDLTVNSILLHGSGTTINGQITIHFLTLDDDDADLTNGSPHYHEINNGFAAHNLAGPPLNGYTIQAVPNNQNVCAPADAIYTINIGQVGSVTGNVNLSVSGAPAGATISINPNPVAIPGSATLTIGNTTNAATGSATMTITGTMAPYVHSTNASVYIATAAPTTPVLTSPADGAVGVAVVPTLSWQASPQAQSYLVQVATDVGFTSIVYSANPTTNSHLLGSPLDTLTQYFWRVQATNPCGTTDFSSTFGFRTMAVPPILLVDDDDNSPNTRQLYTDALNSLGLTYDIWDVANNTAPEPTYSDLLPYRIIIWFSGDSFGGTSNPKAGPKAVTEAAIQQWLSEGRGCFFLSSQDYLWDRIGSGSTTPNAFMQQYMGMAAPVNHDENYLSINAGLNVFAGFGPWTLTFSSASGGPGISNFSDQVPPTASALQSFTYGASQLGSSVTHDGDVYRTAFFGFPIESIPTAADRTAVVSRLLGWCGELFPPLPPCTGDVNEDAWVDVADLLVVINAWGSCAGCPADVNADGQVNVSDMLAVINAWGACR